MKRLLPLLLVFFACTSTQVTNVYRDPGLTGFAFKRVAAIAIVKDPEVRKVAEDEMVKHLGAKGVASYSVLTPQDESSAEAVAAKLASSGIDGAVTMRLLSAGQEPMDVRGDLPDSYKAFTGAYGGRRGGADSWEDVVRVETQIFAVDVNKLLWSAATKSFRSADAKEVVAAVAKSVAEELRKDGLLR